MRQTPLSWRRDWALHRAKDSTDSHGDPVRTYDITTPDYVGAAGTATGVCWQITDMEHTVEMYGEQSKGAASFVLYDTTVEIEPFDRCIFGGGIWEVRAVNLWNHHRLVELERVI